MIWDGPVTLLAPLVAIGAAMATHRVVPSLCAGAVVAAVVANRGDPSAAASALAGYAWSAVFDWDHLRISMFSMAVAATVALMQASGGTRALVGLVDHLARGRRGAMVSSWLSGLIIFFDDYANCLVVGGAMGPVCDRAGVSRAKLSYIVDATAAPVASLAVVSTWVGFETGLIADALAASGRDPNTAFTLLLDSLPYRFYSWVTIAFVGAVALTGRDFGPMLAEEVRALRSARSATRDEVFDRARWWAAAAPVAVLVLFTFGLMWGHGYAALGDAASTATFSEVLGAADAYGAMLTGSLTAMGLAFAAALWLGERPRALLSAASGGARMVLEALAVLYCAWTLGDAVRASGAAPYLSSLLERSLSGELLPAATYVVAVVISFATGTSFGTMAILTPLVVPLAVGLDGGVGYILAGTTGAVLAGSCMGDHASPISDTTVLSALGSGVDLMTHVRTQLPYAVSAGVIALVVGHIPAGYGIPPLSCNLAALSACFAMVQLLGRRPEEVEPELAPPTG